MNNQQRIKQILIALDQIINTLIWVGDSYADETMSARAFRMTDVSKGWNRLHQYIDRFFKIFFKQDNHCYKSYLQEVERRHLPIEYHTSRLHAAFLTPMKDQA